MRSTKDRAQRMSEIKITIVHDLNVPMSMEEFVLIVLANLRGKSAFVHQMLKEFNDYRVRDLHKKPGKYTSFRAIISTMKKNGYIESTTLNRSEFDPSAYRITDGGSRRLQFIQDRK